MTGRLLEEDYQKYWEKWREGEKVFYKLLAPNEEEIRKEQLKARLQIAYQLKDAGNALFRQQDYNSAIQKYIETIEAVPRELFANCFNEEYDKLKLAVITNLSICFGRSKNNEAAVLQCKEGLKIYPNNVKLLYILGVALGDSQEYDQAIEVLKIAKVLDPANREVLEKIKAIGLVKKEYNLKMKEMFGGKLKPLPKKEIMEEKPKIISKTQNWGYYLLGAVSVVGLAGILYKKLR